MTKSYLLFVFAPLMIALLAACVSRDTPSSTESSNTTNISDQGSTSDTTNGSDTTSSSSDEGCEYLEFTTEQQSCDTYVGMSDITITTDTAADTRTIITNGIPDHNIGSDQAIGSSVIEEYKTITLDLTPEHAESSTELFPMGPTYYVGIALNGVFLDNAPGISVLHSDDGLPSIGPDLVYDPTMIEPASGFMDCNDGHVSPLFNNYHYHGSADDFAISTLGADGSGMVLLGWAADGYPIYYRYAYEDANDATSALVDMAPSYLVAEGERDGDGVTAPCGDHDGTIWGDWEYVEGSGDLDECHGRTGVTPEFPGGTYYYMAVADTPHLPRCLMGIPSEDLSLALGGGDNDN